MEQTIYFEDYELGHVRLTTGRTITETDFVVHAGHTAHGTMVFSIGVGLTASLINPVAFSYGYDKLRFVRPVFIGDTIKTRVTIADKHDDPKRAECGRVIERCEVINQRNEVVLAADHILIAERRVKTV